MSRNRSAFLSKHPICAFCGGATKATTLDHVPGAGMFSGKQRPKGFEFPACRECNSNTRNSEQFVAFFSRFTRLPFVEESDYDKRRVSVENNTPEAFGELAASISCKDGGHSSVISIPTVKHIHYEIEKFACKLGMAFYYHLTGKVLPNSGAVVSQWEQIAMLQVFGNENLLRRLSGSYGAMGQGIKTSGGQFIWQSYIQDKEAPEDIQEIYRFLFIFYDSLLINVFVSARSVIFDKLIYRIWKPGFRVVKGTQYNYPTSNTHSVCHNYDIPEPKSFPKPIDYRRALRLRAAQDTDLVKRMVLF